MATRKSTGAVAKKKIAETSGGKMNLQFLKGLNGDEISEKEVQQLLRLMAESVTKEDPQTVRSICEAITTISESETGFFALYRAGTLESLGSVLENIEGVQLDVQVAYNAMVRQAANWISNVDHVDFFQLPQVLELATRFAGEYRSVALSTVATLHRFSVQMATHRLHILQADGLHLLHRILSAHRSPEFCQETLTLLFFVCDVPLENAKPKLLNELSLIKSVVETLDQAPVNMRLQVTGLRLLALWMNFEDKRIEKAMKEANVSETFRTALENLSKAGFSHAASWIDSIGGAAFEEKEKARPTKEKESKEKKNE